MKRLKFSSRRIKKSCNIVEQALFRRKEETPGDASVFEGLVRPYLNCGVQERLFRSTKEALAKDS
jgi:hypothetical protein